LPSATACDVQAPCAPSQVLSGPSQPRVPKTPLSPSRLSPLDFLRLCGSSFAADARTTSLQFRRAIRSFATGSLNPLIRDLRHELHQLRIRLSRTLSDVRWKELRTRDVSASETSWRALKSAVPQWLIQRLGIRETRGRKSESRASSRANRRRAILSVRRWLHEPLTSQQKRAHGNPRRSVT